MRLFEAARGIEVACRTGTAAEWFDLRALEAALSPLLRALTGAFLTPSHDVDAAPDRSAVAACLRELRLLLDEHDAAAGDTLDALRTMLGSDSRVERIGNCLGRYDFPGASAAAAALAVDYGAGQV
jgi:hypothetical protein